MAFTECRYCEHRNPPDAKYCNACGATLTLAPCPRCGAAVEVTATSCYQCQGSLQQSQTLVLAPSGEAHARTEKELKKDLRIDKLENALVLKKVDEKVDLSEPRGLTEPAAISGDVSGKKRRLLAALATATVASLIAAVMGYQAYREHFLARRPPASAESVPSKIPSGPVEETSAPEPVAAPATPVGSNESSAVSSCPEGVTALGLCTQQQGRRGPDAAALPGFAPTASDANAPCTAAVAALGLCTSNSN